MALAARKFSEDRFELCRVDDRQEIGTLPVGLSPDAVIFAIGAEELSENSWILRAQHRGSLKNIPWVISAPAGSGKILSSQFQNRLIHIVEDHLESDAFRRGVELVIRLQRSRTAAEEAKLELDIAYAEMEKNREALKSARTEIQQRKKNTGEALLKVAREVQHPLTAMLAYADSVARSGNFRIRCVVLSTESAATASTFRKLPKTCSVSHRLKKDFSAPRSDPLIRWRC